MDSKEAFEDWLHSQDCPPFPSYQECWLKACAYQRAQDLAHVGQVMQHSGTGDHQTAFLKACTMIADRIKAEEPGEGEG